MVGGFFVVSNKLLSRFDFKATQVSEDHSRDTHGGFR